MVDLVPKPESVMEILSKTGAYRKGHFIYPNGKHASYEGRVMCFFEVGDGKGTLLRFDYDHPPQSPHPARRWHWAKALFNKTYWHTVPLGRV